MPWAPTGEGGRGRVAAAAVLLGAFAAGAMGCRSDEPALTLVFQAVPAGTRQLAVTLHAPGATFSGPDASDAHVVVSYVGGDVQIDVDAAFAAQHADRIRLPLTAGANITQLDATARATGGADERTARTTTMIAAHQGATLTFDFAASDGGDDVNADVHRDAGADGGDTPSPPDAAPDVVPDAPSDMVPDAATDLAPDAPRDVAPDVSPDVAGPDSGSRPDTASDAPVIGTHCTVSGSYAASTAIGGGGPTVAYSGADLFGVAWKATNGDILYNAVTPAGALRLSADKTVVSATGQSLSGPRLARIGADFVLAYGRRDSSGAEAAVVRVAAQTGTPGTTPATGTSTAGAAAPPELGGLAVSGDEGRVAVISRPPGATGHAAVVDLFTTAPAFVVARAPAELGTAQTSGIGWGLDRFIAGAVIDATNGGGTLRELADTDLTLQQGYPFTRGSDAPTVGGSGATMSIAGAGDRVAVAWVDSQSGTREVRVAVLSLSTRTPLAAVQASAESSTTKSFPHVVFDGAAFALVWIEGDAAPSARLKLARFDADLAPVGASPMNIGDAGALGLGDVDIAAAGPNAYGIAGAGATSPQQLFYVTCN